VKASKKRQRGLPWSKLQEKKDGRQTNKPTGPVVLGKKTGICKGDDIWGKRFGGQKSLVILPGGKTFFHTGRNQVTHRLVGGKRRRVPKNSPQGSWRGESGGNDKRHQVGQKKGKVRFVRHLGVDRGPEDRSKTTTEREKLNRSPRSKHAKNGRWSGNTLQDGR